MNMANEEQKAKINLLKAQVAQMNVTNNEETNKVVIVNDLPKNGKTE